MLIKPSFFVKISFLLIIFTNLSLARAEESLGIIQNQFIGIDEVLKRSAYGGSEAPKNLLNGKLDIYNPILLTIVGSLRSREPGKVEGRWQQVELQAQEDSICKGGIKAKLRLSQTNSPFTFIIFPGSYASLKRGSFTNQASEILTRNFYDANIIAFPGYLTPTYLTNVCQGIPWDREEMAMDLYLRLQVLLSKIKAKPSKTGLLGYSGGGYFSMALLAFDAMAAQKGEQRFFNLGGLSFSPLLHGRTTFNILDKKAQTSPIDRSYALTTMDWKNIWAIVSNFGLLDWEDVIKVFKERPGEFSARFFNEFSVVDLADTLKAVNVDPSKLKGELSYYNTYITNGFAKNLKGSLESINEKFDKATSVAPLLKLVDSPLLIYFSQDDPILSNSEISGQPEEVTEMLKRAAENPHIKVFNPKFGGHIGATVDPIYEELITDFFNLTTPLSLKSME